MGRRTWIKIFSEKWLRGTIRQEKPEVRGVWIDILALAGDSAYGDDGIIGLAPECGLTNDQICTILNISPKLWKEATNIFIKTQRISVNGTNEIAILNWSKYQSEYKRQKKYRKELSIEETIVIITEEIKYDYSSHKKRREEDPKYKINDAMRVALYQAIKTKKAGRRWEKIVGYSLEELMNHLEKQFKVGMDWTNYGQWHIDHRIPKSKFRFRSISDAQFILCWSLENLQPLWANENLIKGKNIKLQDKVTLDSYTAKLLREREGEGERDKKENTSVRSEKPIAPHNKKINFNFEKEIWENITDKDKEGWRKAYPACDIDIEIAQIREWFISNPSRKKQNYRRCITNWLTKSQERGGRSSKQKEITQPPYAKPFDKGE